MLFRPSLPWCFPIREGSLEQQLARAAGTTTTTTTWICSAKLQFSQVLQPSSVEFHPCPFRLRSRCKESGSREEVLRAVRSDVSSYRQVAAAPGERPGVNGFDEYTYMYIYVYMYIYLSIYIYICTYFLSYLLTYLRAFLHAFLHT